MDIITLALAKKYADEKLTNVKVDLTGYAKEDYVDAEIEELNKKIVQETGKLSEEIEDVKEDLSQLSEEIADITKELYDWIPLTNFELDNGVYMWSADVPTLTENSAYKGLVLNVSGGERYKIYLTLLGTALKNYYLYTDEKIYASGEIRGTDTPTELEFEISIPKGVTKLVLNTPIDKKIYMYRYENMANESNFALNEIEDILSDYVKMDSEIITQKYFSWTNTKEPDLIDRNISDCALFDVVEGERYKIDVWSQGNGLYDYMIYGSGTILECGQKGAESLEYRSYEIIIPKGANKLYVNAYTGMGISVYKYTISADKYSINESIPFLNYGLPCLYLNGDISGMSKDTKKQLSYLYRTVSDDLLTVTTKTGTCTAKWQGSSSINYPKKNYTVTFDNPFEARDGWGEQSKYVLKANWIDFSHVRNVISAKLWGQIVKSRSVKNENLFDLPNGGAIDGFPCLVFINEEYKGLYTFTIPKDKWLFNMGESETECIISAEKHTDATKFKANALVDGSDFDFEYIKDENSTDWAKTSLNTMISACMSGGSDFESTVGQYIDIDSAIDYYIFTCLLTGLDIVDKNYLLVTFDGVKWIFSAYDLDSVFGNHYYGKTYLKTSDTPNFYSFAKDNSLMNLIKTHAKDKLKERYADLRKGIMSEDNILYEISNYLAPIPKRLFDEEVKMWANIPATQTNNLAQITEYYRLRAKILDDEIEKL